VIVALALCGCGESGSDPPQSPEARFVIQPTGQVTFRVDSLIGGGVNHTSLVGQQFTTTSAFSIVLESAAAPFGGSFTLVSGAQITVTLAVISGIAQTQVSDFATTLGATATVVIGGPLPVMPGPGNPEVRFDICAPLSGQVACSITTGTGAFGVQFSGTIGDRFTSYVVSGATPSIFFFEAPKENVNAVFARQPMTGDLLVVGLSVNGQPVKTQADTGDVVLREDL
jgi:hypothetical protein